MRSLLRDDDIPTDGQGSFRTLETIQFALSKHKLKKICSKYVHSFLKWIFNAHAILALEIESSSVLMKHFYFEA